METAAKLILLATLGVIAYQDFGERWVWVILFPLFGIIGGFLYWQTTTLEMFVVSALMNIIVVSIVLLSILLISRLVLKKRFQEVLGLGDVLFFLGFALCFPTVGFLNFFVFSILFTLSVALVFKAMKATRTDEIPLAGCMSVFLIAVYLAQWTSLCQNIYVL